jgi:hypothetical protein
LEVGYRLETGGFAMQPTKVEIKEFLDELRESGTTNMCGAAIDLRGEFGMSKQESRTALKVWMEEF